MDFPNDKNVLDINDEFMFGKSILVCPVTEAMYSKDGREDFSIIKSKELYLPKGSDWYDFWTGEKFTGGQILKKETPLDVMPLYVKSGTILPIGPKVQYATEKKWNNLEIRIYEGADGEFTLYEDEGDNYNYEKGLYSTIKFSWNDKEKKLTIGKREGSFPGILANRTFRIVLVSTEKGKGMEELKSVDRVVTYRGLKEEIVLK